MNDITARARAALDVTDCTDEMWDFFRVGVVRELLAEVERLRGCPHDSWSGDGTGRWRCDECDADQGSQDVGEIRRQLVDTRAEVERLRAGRANQEVLMASAADQYDKVSAEVERLRGALGECVTFWRGRYDEVAPHEYGDYNTALWDCISNVEAVLRGDK